MPAYEGRPTVAEVSLAALRHNCRQAARARRADRGRDGGGEGGRLRPRRRRRGARVRRGGRRGARRLHGRGGRRAPPCRAHGARSSCWAASSRARGAAVAEHDLEAAVWTLDGARALAAAARAAGRTAAVHVKVDTGMTRLGHRRRPRRAALRRRRCAARRRRRRAASSRTSRPPTPSTRRRRARSATASATAVEALAAAGVRPPLVHLANSAAVLCAAGGALHHGAPGLMLYGYAPAPHLATRAPLPPAMRLRTAVAQMRRVPAGHAGRLRRHVRHERDRAPSRPAGRLRRRLPPPRLEPRRDAGARAPRRRSPGGCAWTTR